MERFMDLVRKYPLWIAGAVLAVVLLIWLSSRDTASGPQVSAITSFGPSDASVNANAQVQIAQMGYVAQGAANAAALEGMAIEADVAKYKYGLDAASYDKMLDTTRSITEKDADTALAMATGQFKSNENIATIVTNAQTQQSQIGANAATSLAEIQKNSALAQANTNAELQKSLAQMGYSNQQVMAQLGFAQDQAMFDKNAQFQREQNAAADAAAAAERQRLIDVNNINKERAFLNTISGGFAGLPYLQ